MYDEERLSTFENNRYTWHHNCLLLEIAKSIADCVKHVNTLPTRANVPQKLSVFVKAGARVKKANRQLHRTGLVHLARDWTFDFHMPEWEAAASYTFPSGVALTNLLPDGVLISRQAKICIIIELTAPLEENIRSWNVKKTDKYKNETAAQCEPGWRVEVLALEVGAKGWIPSSFFRTFKKLGVSSSQARKIANNCELLARKCSYLIWTNRFNKQFEPWRITISPTLDRTFHRKRSHSASALSSIDIQRIRRNRAIALQKLKKKVLKESKKTISLSAADLQRIQSKRDAALLKREIKRKQKAEQKIQEEVEAQAQEAGIQADAQEAKFKEKFQDDEDAADLENPKVRRKLVRWADKDGGGLIDEFHFVVSPAELSQRRSHLIAISLARSKERKEKEDQETLWNARRTLTLDDLCES